MRRMDRIRLGRLGEELARLVYAASEYDCVESRWRCRIGELDLVLRRAEVLVFCEVKTRRGEGYGSPASAVDRRRLSRIRRTARYYLAAHSFIGIREFRFDVASVLLDPHGHGAEISLLQGVV